MKLTKYDLILIKGSVYSRLMSTCGLTNGTKVAKDLVKMFKQEKKRRKEMK